MRSFAAVLTLAAAGAAMASVDLSAPVHDQSMIDMINQKNAGWTAGVNDRFLNATLADAVRLLGVKLTGEANTRARAKLGPAPKHLGLSVPAQFNAAENWPQCADVINHVRDQAGCGSCWAMASTEAFNDRMCIAHNYTTELSAQDTASCCNLFGGCFGSQGCDGGQPAEAWNYFVKTGIVTGGDYNSGEGCFPYALPNCDHHEGGPYPKCQEGGNTPACPNPKACSNSKYTTPWAQDLQHAKSSYGINGAAAMQEDIMKYGSITVAFSVYSDFLTYKTGVYKHTTGSFLGGHAVKIQGWGTENGQDYWLVLNSWNTYWGDKGFFKIARGVDECGIEDQPVAGLV